ncbi:heavy metal translocating P-type ATPase [Paenibacillus sp. SC116]|uniref:heavy metal translocating P-type ATPase n=1 Tax=Paenibacillus sp. SC116 TaxID=2968986 RepID=UPI00215B2400|nr:heavy metal translocating P-type ATPase [Paenibacillus sp. SC116]MCR8842257.1 heavy metal translocating P-type ATPase [Paenibacillus sp. SC116]
MGRSQAGSIAQTQLELEGVHCAGCVAKIENGLRKIEGVTSCNLNFVNQTLIIESTQAVPSMVETAKQVIRDIDPSIKVKEKVPLQKMKLTIEGMDCAGCVAKIEKGVATIPGVQSASVNFVTKQLTIEANAEQLQHVTLQTEQYIRQLDSKFTVQIEGNSDAQPHSQSASEGKSKLPYIRLAASIGLTFVAVWGGLSSNLALALFLVAYVLAGGDVLYKALRNITRGRVFDENFLMSIATIGAFIIGEYPEGVAVMIFYQIGELFQSIAINRSRKSIRALMDIRPDYANLKVNGELRKVSPEEIQIGDVIVVKPGERVPLDGKVIDGVSMLDTSALTGESIPREVEAGSEILSGFINKNGVLTVEVTKAYKDSTVSKILDLVQNASSRKAPTENYITKFARYYTPVVVITAAFITLLPPLFFAGEAFSDWFYRALVFLVISCPCALVVSIPLGFFGGIGGASKNGILVKGSNYLEALNDVKYVVFDKTGTLTKGIFVVTEVQPHGDLTEEQLMRYAAYAEVYSNHPIALSIVNAYGQNINKDELDHYEEISGHGISVNVSGQHVLAGNAKLMKREGISYVEPESVGTLVHVAVDQRYAGYIVIADEVKEDAAAAIQELKSLGVKKTIMLTGDVKRVGDAVGQKLGLDEIYSELLPQHKVEQLERIDAQKLPKEKVIFVGDGINDTPVLARADVGVAMGGLGSDAAIEAADIVIMTDEPSKIPAAIRMAKRTRKIVYQNIFFALGVKALFLLLGAFGIATMWEAVFADVGVTLLAVLNAMRAMKPI